MNTNTLPEVTETRQLPAVVLAGTTYQVTETHFSSYRDQVTGETRPAASSITLEGPRGASYFLRGYLGQDTGLRQVISWKSGQPLRRRGNEIRVVELAGVIEVAR